MITFKKFGRYGRLGNQLFQYAALMGLASKYKKKLTLPEWVYDKYFEGPFPSSKNIPYAVSQEEEHFHYGMQQWAKLKSAGPVDISGYLQSEKYWTHCKDHVLGALKFKKEFMRQLENQWPIDNEKKCIAISIRRGDYVGNPNYELLPVSYYFLALQKYFPAWQDMNLVIFSDDPNYCKLHFGCLENAYIIPNSFDNLDKNKYFDENRSAMAQLAMMTMCDHFIIANSTFSWWGAYLGEQKGSKVIRPAHHFAGKLLKNCDIKDHYPDRWISFNHKDRHGNLKRIDLCDVTFTIPVRFDHNDRRQNLDLNVCMLQRSFETNIVIDEQGSNEFRYFSKYCYYRKSNHKYFHRTRMLNDMARAAATKIFANWDADVFIPPIQIWKSVQEIREGADMVYPYDGRFARMPRQVWFREIEKHLDVGIVGDKKFRGMDTTDKRSVGGAIFFNREKFFEGGAENENFISYGPEDVERYERFYKLGYQVKRISGALYHMDHFCGPDSMSKNSFYDRNHAELEKIQRMNKQQLKQYIKSWKWKHTEKAS